jgi:phage gp29-like protein
MRAYLTKALSAVSRAFGVSEAIERAQGQRVGMTSRVVQDQAIWHQYQRIGGGMTPMRLSQIIRTADSGDLAPFIDLLNESRQKDGHLHGVLSQAEESIGELPWQLTLPDTARRRDRKAKEWAEETLRACTGSSPDETRGFQDIIPHLAGAFYYGHGVTETAWGKDSLGYLSPRGFYLLSARRFGYRQGDSAFVWRDESTGYHGVQIQVEYPNRFVVFQPRVNGDVPVREGLGRVLMWCALFRNWSVSDWLRTAELSWKPWRIGYYEKGASEPDIENLKTVMSDLVTTGSAVLASSTNFKVEWAGGSGGSSSRPTHAELFNVVAMEMSKAVLGATETVQSSSSSGYAQASVHKGVSRTILRSRARQLAACITRDLIRPMIHLNFGKKVMVPKFEFVLPDLVEVDKFGPGIAKLVEAGLKIPQAWARARIGAPEPDEDDEIMVMGGTAEAPETDDTPDPEPSDDGGEPPPTEGDGEDAPTAEDIEEPAAA